MTDSEVPNGKIDDSWSSYLGLNRLFKGSGTQPWLVNNNNDDCLETDEKQPQKSKILALIRSYMGYEEPEVARDKNNKNNVEFELNHLNDKPKKSEILTSFRTYFGYEEPEKFPSTDLTARKVDSSITAATSWWSYLGYKTESSGSSSSDSNTPMRIDSSSGAWDWGFGSSMKSKQPLDNHNSNSSSSNTTSWFGSGNKEHNEEKDEDNTGLIAQLGNIMNTILSDEDLLQDQNNYSYKRPRSQITPDNNYNVELSFLVGVTLLGTGLYRTHTLYHKYRLEQLQQVAKRRTLMAKRSRRKFIEGESSKKDREEAMPIMSQAMYYGTCLSLGVFVTSASIVFKAMGVTTIHQFSTKANNWGKQKTAYLKRRPGDEVD